MISRRVVGLACAGLFVLTSGCIESPPRKLILTPPTTGAGFVPPSLQDAERANVVRVRSRTCDGVGVGSGFLLAEGLLITNRHVVEGSVQIEVDTWDGRQLSVAVASQTSLDDLAVLRLTGVVGTHAELAAADPVPGDSVRAVGYPHGDQVTSTPGRVVDYVDGERYESVGQVLRASNDIAPGNSGGPLLDTTGRVVGVVYAIDLKDGKALAIPVSRLASALARADRFAPVVPCSRR